MLVTCIVACGPTKRALESNQDPDAGDVVDADAVDAADDVDAPLDTGGCPSNDPSVYSPFRSPGAYPNDSVANLPWRGNGSMYPNGDEDFSSYGTLPATVECGDDKSLRSYVDVTAGCLVAIDVGTYTRGQIKATTDGYYRSIALGYDTSGSGLPIKWTDQSIEYRFYYTAQTGAVGNPGFKAFARYRTEDDLYVASWRSDGVAQIQRKQCGVYTPLIILDKFGAPTPNAWHYIRFDAVGDKLSLYLDHVLVASATDTAFDWGTAGIRVDSMDGSMIDDWRVFAP
jgi:hypothetical protein